MSGVGIGEASLKEGGEFKSDEFSLDGFSTDTVTFVDESSFKQHCAHWKH